MDFKYIKWLSVSLLLIAKQTKTRETSQVNKENTFSKTALRKIRVKVRCHRDYNLYRRGKSVDGF